jgi:hypothetical protein
VSLRILPVGPDTVTVWRDVHNAIIPAHSLTSDDVIERLTRNSLSLAYDGDELVGNAAWRLHSEMASWNSTVTLSMTRPHSMSTSTLRAGCEFAGRTG